MNAFREVQSLLDQIRTAANNPTIERASDQIEVLCRAQFALTEDFLPHVHFTRAERSILNLLRAKMDKTVSKDALLDAYGWASVNSPHPATLGVLICRIRATLKRSKAPFHIITEQGLGFRLVEGAQTDSSRHLCSKTKYMMAA
jgi:DNA-binding response OmpR family regulator